MHILIYSPTPEIGCSREVAKGRGEEMRSSRGYLTPHFLRELNMVFNSVFNQLQGKAVVGKCSQKFDVGIWESLSPKI